MAVKLVGMDIILKNLNKKIGEIEGRTIKGLLEAATKVKLVSVSRTPVDKDFLRPGHYLATGGDNKNPIVEVGTTASYSIYVHENMENHHPVGQAKFLESAIKDTQGQVLEIIKKAVEL